MEGKQVETKTTSGFTMIPNSLILSEKALTDSEFRLWSILRYHAFQKKFCFPGRNRLSKEMNASVSKIDRVKKTLEEKGLIAKERRGRGITNIYRFGDNFFSEADKSLVGCANELSMTRKEYQINNTKSNNYLGSQISNEISFKGEHSKSENISKTPTDIVIRSMLNREEKKLINSNILDNGELLESDFKMAKEGIYYYLMRYKEIAKVEHPRYVAKQLNVCFYNLICEIKDIRELSYDVNQISDIVKSVIERWFATTSGNPNNLLLSHFIGGEDNEIFTNCFNALSFNEENG